MGLDIRYTVLLSESAGTWAATVPDLAGCESQAPTIAEALERVATFAVLHVTALVEAGKEVPSPNDYYLGSVEVHGGTPPPSNPSNGDVPFVAITDEPEAKEVFARYGRAAYFAQVLEHEMVNFLVGAQISSGSRKVASIADMEAVWDNAFSLTVGNIARELRKSNVDLSPFEDDFRLAKEHRDNLAHRFFRTHAMDLIGAETRAKMIEELDAMVDHFQSLDDKLTPIDLAMWTKLGLTEDHRAKAWAEVLEKVGEPNPNEE